MKLQRKTLVRNLVLAIIVADGVGLYYLKDRLSNPLQDSAAVFEEEALAAAASEAAAQQAAQKSTTSPQQQALASHELPKPAFGIPEAAPAVPAVPAAVVKSAASQPAQSKPAAVPALAKAPTPVAAPATKPAAKAAPAPAFTAKAAAKAAPAPAFTAKRTISVPRVAAVNSSKTPVTLSVTPSSSNAKAKAPAHKRASIAKAVGFTKAFGVSRAAPTIAVTTSSGSLQQAGPVITAEFAPDATQPVEQTLEVTTTLAMASQADTVTTDQAPARDTSAPAPSEAAPIELAPSGE